MSDKERDEILSDAEVELSPQAFAVFLNTSNAATEKSGDVLRGYGRPYECTYA
jgi:hypothetical protein